MLEYYRFKQISELYEKGQQEAARLQLAELQRRYVALCDENLSCKTQIQEFEDILYLARNLFFDGELYWLVTGSIKQGPFCPECYNRDGVLMRLAGEPDDRQCPFCRTPYAARPAYREAAMGAEGQSVHEGPRGPAPAKAPVRGKVIPFQRH